MSYGIIQGIVNNVVATDQETGLVENKFFVNLTSPIQANVNLDDALIIFNSDVAGLTANTGYYIVNFNNPDPAPGNINFKVALTLGGSATSVVDVASSDVTFLIVSAAVASSIDGTPITIGGGFFAFDYTELLNNIFFNETTVTLSNSTISSTGILTVGSGQVKPGMQLLGTGIQKGQRLKSTAAMSSGNVARVSFVQQSTIPFIVGQIIKVTGIEPYNYNGDFKVVACTNNYVEYAVDSNYSNQTKSGVIESQPVYITEKFAENRYRINLDEIVPVPTPVVKIIESINAQNIITISSHGYTSSDNGLKFSYLTDGVPADGVVNGQEYYIRIVDANSITLHDSLVEATNDDDNTRIKVAILQNSQSENSQQTLELQGTATITGTLYPINSAMNIIANNSRILGDKAKGDGIRIISPWEWLGQSGMVQFLEGQGANLDELKAKVDQIEKS